MKIAYFDCFSGISGDMTLGAIVANGIPIEQLAAEIVKLGLTGYEMKATPVIKKGISGMKVDVIIHEKQVFRHLPQIETIIQSSLLPEAVKQDSLKVFRRLGAAEAKVHGIPIEKVHFHEVGAMDSIIDIIGSVIGLYLLGVEKIYASRLNVGTGFVKSEHGVIPVPAPATVELCQGVPVYSNGIQKELVTPTGAALLTTLAEGFGNLPEMKISSVGYGAGGLELESQANLLRLMIGDSQCGTNQDTILVLESNLDDMNPQNYDYLMEKLFASGALDVYLTPIQMKKNRPGVMLSVLAKPADQEKIEQLILEETTTFGIRAHTAVRRILSREFVVITTSHGDVKVKIGFLDGKIYSVTPEYEECKKIACQSGIPLKEIQREVLQKYYQTK
jgi:uncharacterized protein (TIGR00299 family) protein